MDEKRGKRRITSYTKSGINASPYCSSSFSFNRSFSWSGDVAESMTLNSRKNKILRRVNVSLRWLMGDQRYPYKASSKGVTSLKLCLER